MHDSQLNWITSHGATLQELYLDNCPIIYEVMVEEKDTDRTLLEQNRYAPHPRVSKDNLYASYDKRWANYFRAIEARLPHLWHFLFGRSPMWWHNNTAPFEDETRIRIGFHDALYMTYCEGYGPSQYMQSLIWDVKDEAEEDVDYKSESRVKPSKEDIIALEQLLKKMGQSVDLDQHGQNCQARHMS